MKRRQNKHITSYGRNYYRAPTVDDSWPCKLIIGIIFLGLFTSFFVMNDITRQKKQELSDSIQRCKELDARFIAECTELDMKIRKRVSELTAAEIVEDKHVILHFAEEEK